LAWLGGMAKDELRLKSIKKKEDVQP
jgi:hypothetical protein